MKRDFIIIIGFCAMTAHSQTREVKTQTVTVKNIAQVEKMKLDFCKPFALEIVGLYPIIKTLSLWLLRCCWLMREWLMKTIISDWSDACVSDSSGILLLRNEAKDIAESAAVRQRPN
ncbi:MAG TPA: hypothetical protein PLS51_01545 [Flavobacterium sp.]|jgi:hypothetical protein|nr:hypothetical protein [Flavobacterium sp.]HPJ09285.1 hypothetical protein [Flavobacterium sp.]